MKYESISTRGIEHAQPSNANNRMHNKPEVHHPLPGPLSGACGFGSSSHSLRQPGCQTFLTAQPSVGFVCRRSRLSKAPARLHRCPSPTRCKTCRSRCASIGSWVGAVRQQQGEAVGLLRVPVRASARRKRFFDERLAVCLVVGDTDGRPDGPQELRPVLHEPPTQHGP